MDANANVCPARGVASQSTLTGNMAVIGEHASGNIALAEDSDPENLRSSNVYICLVKNACDAGVRENSFIDQPRLSPAYIQSDEEHSNTLRAEKQTDPERDSNQVVLPIIPEQIIAPAPELPLVLAIGSVPAIDSNDLESPAIIRSQESSLLRLRTLSETSSRDEGDREASLDGALSHIPMPHTKLDRVPGADLARPTDEETRDEFGHPCDDFAFSFPPSSSPPQLFSSSPCASSQSSTGNAESPQMTVADNQSSRDCSHPDGAAMAALDVESEHLHDHDTVAGTKKLLEINLTLCVEGSPCSKKRTTYQCDGDESHGSQPTKRSKPDSHLYLPPAPMRTTLASQNRQFRKLAAPFRPPSKLPVARDKPARDTNDSAIESAEISHNKPDLKALATDVLRPPQKVSRASRSVSQFKSPLINKVLPTDTRTIRLTPALQTLQRKLQQLKRAVRVKEDNEEEVLKRLATKWIEAGREAAYEVWGATKEASDFAGKAVPVRSLYGWENTNDGNENPPWGWDNKDDQNSCNLDPSSGPHSTERSATEEGDNVVLNNTLGTMLHRLGIAPEIFGWDDDKETFSDEYA